MPPKKTRIINNHEKQKKENIKKLETMAERVLNLKQEVGLKRPLLIEFCGSPKSGKTTCITSLNIFLKRNGFKTAVLTERASICPIPDKTDPYFNVWTSCSAIAELLEKIALGTDTIDVIIADRAIFDALCWFEWQNTNPSPKNSYLSNDNYNSLNIFLKSRLLTKNIDLIYVFNAAPEVSLEREYAHLLTEKRGSIMNEMLLSTYNEAIDETIYKNKNAFRRIEQIDTSNLQQVDTSYKVTNTILTVLEDMLIEKIGYFRFSDLEDGLTYGINNWESVKDLQIEFNNRNKVESDFDLIQPIPICIVTNEARDKVLILKKNERATRKDSPERDKILLWAGGHIRNEDEVANNKTLIATIINGLDREIHEELGESITINSDVEPFLIYTPNTEKSKRHFAVCFELILDLDNKKFNPRSIEFIQKTGKSISGTIHNVSELQKQHASEDFDSWSIQILRHIFKFNFENKEQQIAMQL